MGQGLPFGVQKNHHHFTFSGDQATIRVTMGSGLNSRSPGVIGSFSTDIAYDKIDVPSFYLAAFSSIFKSPLLK